VAINGDGWRIIMQGGVLKAGHVLGHDCATARTPSRPCRGQHHGHGHKYCIGCKPSGQGGIQRRIPPDTLPAVVTGRIDRGQTRHREQAMEADRLNRPLFKRGQSHKTPITYQVLCDLSQRREM
jgi:hypothetical protein